MKTMFKAAWQFLLLFALFGYASTTRADNPSERAAQIQSSLTQAQADEAAAKARYQEAQKQSKALKEKFGPTVDKLKAELNAQRKTMTGTQSVEESRTIVEKVSKLEADLAAAEKAWKRQAVPARRFETDAAWDLNRANTKRLELEKQLAKAQAAAIAPATPQPAPPTPQPTLKPIVPAKPPPSASISPAEATVTPVAAPTTTASPISSPAGKSPTPTALATQTPPPTASPAGTTPTPVAVASAAPSVSEPPVEPDGRGKIIVPDMSVFKGIPEMRGVASHAGLVIKFAAATPDSKDQEFKFAGQFPRAGSDADKGDVLVVSFYQKFDDKTEGATPNVPDEIGEMPNLKKRTVEQAAARLPSNMSIGSVEMGDKPKKPEEALTIYKQIPEAYSKIDPSKKIVVTVIAFGEYESGEASPSPAADSTGSSTGADNTDSGSGDWAGTWAAKGPNGMKISRSGTGYILVGSLTDGKPVPGKVQGSSLVFSWELDLRDVVGILGQTEKIGKKEDSTMGAKYIFTHNGDKLDMVLETTQPGGKVKRDSINGLPRVEN